MLDEIAKAKVAELVERFQEELNEFGGADKLIDLFCGDFSIERAKQIYEVLECDFESVDQFCEIFGFNKRLVLTAVAEAFCECD